MYSLNVTSRLVVLDVTAVDADGMAVTDLTRGEFRIYEDGAPQSIRSFVDPKTLLPRVSEITDTTQLAVFGAVGDSGSLAAEFYDENEAFDALGPLTGGSVVRGLNDLPHRIALAVQNGTEYYTLGYTPTSISTETGRF